MLEAVTGSRFLSVLDGLCFPLKSGVGGQQVGICPCVKEEVGGRMALGAR